jgi:hypothetical protein
MKRECAWCGHPRYDKICNECHTKYLKYISSLKTSQKRGRNSLRIWLARDEMELMKLLYPPISLIKYLSNGSGPISMEEVTCSICGKSLLLGDAYPYYNKPTCSDCYY